MIAYEGNENYIFVSYAHKDSDRVIPIIEALDEMGFRIWYDSGIEAGSEWPANIERHLLNSSRVLVFMTPSCVSSQNCRNEINLACQHRKGMLIVYLEETDLIEGMSLQLNSVQAINAQLHSTLQGLTEALSRAQLLQCCRVDWDGTDDTESDTATNKKSNNAKRQADGRIKSATMTTSRFSPLLKRAFLFLEDGEWETANEYCEKVLDQDPECAEAYIGKLMAELQVKKRDELGRLEFPFNDRNNYKKAVRFGSEELKSELQGYFESIELCRLERIYIQAKDSMMDATTETAFRNVAKIFEDLSGYKDSDTLCNTCIKKANKAKKEAELKRLEELYIKANNAMSTAKNEESYIAAAKKFEEISKYKDSKTLRTACLEKAAEEKEAVRIRMLAADYVRAKKAMDAAKTEADYKSAAKSFELAFDYKDSKELYEECLKKAKLAKEAAELKILETYYIQANTAMNTAKTKDEYINAAKKFELSLGYKDSQELYNACLINAEAARKDAIYSSAKSKMLMSSYTQAIELFVTILDWKDASQQIDVCKKKILEEQIAKAEAEAKAKAEVAAREKAKAEAEARKQAEIERLERERRKEISKKDSWRKAKKVIIIVATIILLIIHYCYVVVISGTLGLLDILYIAFIIFAARKIDRYNKILYRRIAHGTAYEVSKISFYFKTYVIIPEIHYNRPVTSIGKKAFRKSSKITHVTIPNGVTSIGESAFSYCHSLVQINIPNSVTHIGSFAISSCYSLKEISIPDSVTNIEHGAFFCCSKLKKVTVGSGVKSIDTNAFANTAVGMEIIYKGTMAQWRSVAKSDVTSRFATIHCTDGNIQF